MTLDIRNYGKIRGGSNSHARLHICINPEGIDTNEELKAIFTIWDEEFSMTGSNWEGRAYKFNTRREFALLPTMIRKAIRVGYDVETSMWDEGIKDKVSLSQNPELFWQIVAQSQMFFEE